MNGKEAGKILTLLQGAWRSKWSQENEEFWLFELLAFDASEASDAVRLLTAEIDHAPSMHQFLEATQRVRADRRRREDARRAALSPAQVETEAQRAAALKLLRVVKKAMGVKVTHNHTRGIASCAACRAHDHSDVRPFGFTRTHQRAAQPDREGVLHDVTHSTAVPAWYFSCPRCGDPEVVQSMCDTWTSEGIAWMKLHGHRHATAKRQTTTSEAF